jgi:hypothetical protein
MSKPPEKSLDSFRSYVALIEKLQSKASNSLWFRGCGVATYKLAPSLYRHRTVKTKDGIEKLEAQLMTRFRQRSIPLHDRPLSDDWDTLFFMQHYGVPTRLLDWTENPFIAFYFAVTSAKFKGTAKSSGEVTLKFSSDASIWILDPVAWNKHALRQQSYNSGILTPGDVPLNPYKPMTKFSDMYVDAVALYGAHNSPRIVAQRGVFTIFGQETVPMEQAYDHEKFPKSCLLKVTLDRAVLPEMRKSILNQGITESVVFPDLDGLAKEMKREFKFEY